MLYDAPNSEKNQGLSACFPGYKEPKSEIFRLQMLKGHLVAEIEGKKVIVDTGSERSMGNFSTSTWGLVEKPRSIGKLVSLDSISKYVRFQVDGLLGMDLLGTKDWRINLEKGELEIFSGTPSVERVDSEIPVIDFLGVPTIPITIDGKVCQAIVDTGAQISYVNQYFLKDIRATRAIRDFHPLCGYFKTPVFPKSIGIGGSMVQVEVGILPPSVSFILSNYAHVEILGNEIFQYFEATFLFAGKDKKMLLRKFEAPKEVEL